PARCDTGQGRLTLGERARDSAAARQHGARADHPSDQGAWRRSAGHRRRSEDEPDDALAADEAVQHRVRALTASCNVSVSSLKQPLLRHSARSAYLTVEFAIFGRLQAGTYLA